MRREPDEPREGECGGMSLGSWRAVSCVVNRKAAGKGGTRYDRGMNVRVGQSLLGLNPKIARP